MPEEAPSQDLPKGLWIGTAVFAVLAAGALAVMIHLGKTQIEDVSNREIESQKVEASERDLRRLAE